MITEQALAPPAQRPQPHDSRRVILKVTVEVSTDTSDTILVREGDVPQTLAEQFCARHGLQANLVDPLTAHIRENLKRVATDGAPDGASNGVGIGSGHEAAGQPATPQRTASPEDAKGLGHATPVRRASSGAHTTRNGAAIGVCARTAAAATPRQSSAPAGRSTPCTSRAPRPPRTPGNIGPNSFENGSTRTPSAPSRSRAGAASVEERENNLSSGAMATLGQHVASASSITEECSRFERLHQDATQRRLRLDRLRQQVERDLEDQQMRSSIQMSPGSARCTFSRQDTEVPGERLYREAAVRAHRMDGLRTKYDEQRRQEEDRLTFRPEIGASQRTCQGFGRAMRDPEGKKVKKKNQDHATDEGARGVGRLHIQARNRPRVGILDVSAH